MIEYYPERPYSVTETPFGFDWGPAKITRCMSDKKFGVVIEIKGRKKSVFIRVTPSGLIRHAEKFIP